MLLNAFLLNSNQLDAQETLDVTRNVYSFLLNAKREIIDIKKYFMKMEFDFAKHFSKIIKGHEVKISSRKSQHPQIAAADDGSFVADSVKTIFFNDLLDFYDTYSYFVNFKIYNSVYFDMSKIKDTGTRLLTSPILAFKNKQIIPPLENHDFVYFPFKYWLSRLENMVCNHFSLTHDELRRMLYINTPINDSLNIDDSSSMLEFYRGVRNWRFIDEQEKPFCPQYVISTGDTSLIAECEEYYEGFFKSEVFKANATNRKDNILRTNQYNPELSTERSVFTNYDQTNPSEMEDCPCDICKTNKALEPTEPFYISYTLKKDCFEAKIKSSLKLEIAPKINIFNERIETADNLV